MAVVAQRAEARRELRVPLIKADLPEYEVVEPAIREMLTNGRVTNFGPFVTAFEREAEAYLGTSVATTSSGTMGLLFALTALGLKRDEKVLLPSFTFMATAQAVLYAGGIPVFAEIEEDLTLSPADVERKLGEDSRIALVIGVHNYGLPCRTEELQVVVEAAARKRGRPISLLYDAAHAFGSSAHGRRVGTFGNAEVFSLSVTKALVSVEGGMVSSTDPEVIRVIKKMRNYGIEDKYDAHYAGMNGKMSELHAVIGLHNLRKLDANIAARQVAARYYLERIEGRTRFQTLPWPTGVVHTFKDLTVLTPPELDGKRDDVISFLKDRGVETRAYFYPPVHQQRFFQPYADRALPRTESLSRRVITLPFFTTITTGEMDYVVEVLAEAEQVLA